MNFKKKSPASKAEAVDATTSDGKEKKKAEVQNTLAISYLTLSMELLKLLKMIQASKSADWPGGLAYDLVAKLMKKYRPDGVMALAKVTTKLSKLKMGKNDDPEDLEDDIAAMENEYHCQIDEKTRKAFVVKAAGKYYADVI